MIKCGLLDLKEKANALFNINNISHDLKVKLIYTSLAFEYPNISYSEVEDILNGKNNDATLLVNNQNNAFEYIV